MADNVFGTSNIWPNYSTQNINKVTREPKTELGKDEFLQLLVAQLKNQDPTQPVEDREFISQMAQFSSVEQIMNMSQQLSMMRQSMGISSDLIGKNVNFIVWNTATYQEQTMTGIVEGIKMKDGYQYAIVDGQEVSLDQITKIWFSEEEPVVDDGSEESEHTDSTPDTNESTAGDTPVTEGSE
ncbi:flagellar hook assembly protein FlgD [Marinicrinis lubricantis]|uniref:Flagellar hook assembly protein FlgD n=1 Tax=Marinicrinis lubricantis TaxID=2086470 RepID=A0ABW1IMG7_9BACL